MTRFDKTLEKVLRGVSDANIDFDDLRQLLEGLGFQERIPGKAGSQLDLEIQTGR